MKKLGLFILLVAMSAVAYAVTIYKYTGKDGQAYYTGGLPTGLTTAEKAQYTTPTQAQIDAANKGASIPLNSRDSVKAQQRKDNTPVVVPPVVVPPVVVPPVVTPPVTSSVITLPKAAILCGGLYETCTIPAGITAKVWFGFGSDWVTKENVTGSFKCTQDVMGDPKQTWSPGCWYVDNKLLEKVLDPKGVNLMPTVNAALVPAPVKGFSTPLIKAASIPPNDSVGAFRISCEYSHMSNDDPIVFPGVPNSTHHHTFFGNTAANAYSTNETLHNAGNTTCAGGTLNRSGYWMPSLINTNNGAPAKPSVVVVYYKGVDVRSSPLIQPPPFGLRMIAGNAKPLAVADAEGGFKCDDLVKGQQWAGNNIKGSCGGDNQYIRMIIGFPNCWDGKNLDSPDHKSHMAFSCGDECKDTDGKIRKLPTSCPATHPIQIPSITINADFFNLDPTAKYRLASDNYSTAYPGGYSLHADWMNGWDEKTMQTMVTNCLNNPKNCGGPNLGNGQTLYGVNTD